MSGDTIFSRIHFSSNNDGKGRMESVEIEKSKMPDEMEEGHNSRNYG